MKDHDAEGASFPWTGTYDEQIRAAYRLVARHVYKLHGLGDFAYQAFDYINATFFDGRLPELLILWDITAYGGCMGWTRSPADGPPIIKLHPSLVAPATKNAWGAPQLGRCYAYHVLLHETVHVAVNYLHGGIESHQEFKKKWTTHANPIWVGEINRIARLMGIDVTYDMKKYRRVPTGGMSARGKAATKVEFG
jgi:hypothetical protein